MLLLLPDSLLNAAHVVLVSFVRLTFQMPDGSSQPNTNHILLRFSRGYQLLFVLASIFTSTLTGGGSS